MKTRIRFTKTGSAKFIGHLDLMRFFQKAVRRAKLDAAYSKGYSPHQLMSFASPLGVGLTSDGEYIDIEFHTLPDMTKEELTEWINQALTNEIFVTGIKILPEHTKSSMALLRAADYMISFQDEKTSPALLCQKFTDYVNRDEILIFKKTKRSEMTMDIKEHILCHAYDFADFSKKTGSDYPILHNEYQGCQNIYLQLTSGSSVNIRPDTVIDDFLTYTEMDRKRYSYHIHRLEMYFNDNKENKHETIGDSEIER